MRDLTDTAARETFNLLAWFLDHAGLSGTREEEERAPHFEAISSRGRIRLLDLLGTAKTLLLFLDPGKEGNEAVRLRAELPELQRLGITTIGIASRDLDWCLEFSRRHLPDLPVVADPGDRLRRLYGASGTVAFLIAENGRIAAVRRAPLDYKEISRAVRNLHD